MDAPRLNPPGIGELLKGPVVPHTPTRRLDLPRDFWERWGELRGLIESLHSGYWYITNSRPVSQLELIDSLERDLKEMLNVE